MDIIFEIDHLVEKDKFIKEISFSIEQVQKILGIPNLSKMIFSRDFDKTVNEILGINSYKSSRNNHTALARTLLSKDGIVIVISKSLFNEDSFYFINTIIHEMFHAKNPHFNKIWNEGTRAANRYNYLLNTWFDEYQAVRGSYSFCINYLQPINYNGAKGIVNVFQAHLQNFLKNNNYSKLKNELLSLQYHKDLDYFINIVTPLIEESVIDMVYLYTLIDTFYHFKKYETELKKSPFINESSYHLINHFREIYSTDNLIFDENNSIMIAFLRNFGIEFQDLNGELICKTWLLKNIPS